MKMNWRTVNFEVMFWTTRAIQFNFMCASLTGRMNGERSACNEPEEVCASCESHRLELNFTIYKMQIAYEVIDGLDTEFIS